MNENTDRITHILDQIRLLKTKHAVLAAATGEDFNVFSILRIRHREVQTHTPILAELLNPRGVHHQNDAFLKLFLEIIKNHENDDSGKSTFYDNPGTYRVRSEKRIDQAQFDIMLERDNARIVIENKIFAEDQPSQLNRLYQDARKDQNLEDSQIKLIYLTLYGAGPSEKSLEANDGQATDLPLDKVTCISYCEHIISWLEECMNLQEVQRIAPIREVLFQYRDLLKDLTGQPTNRKNIMELSDLLTKDKNYELIPQLEQALLESKIQSQIIFWKNLAKKLTENINETKHPRVQSGFQINGIDEDEELEECVRNYYRANARYRNARYRNFFLYYILSDWEEQSKIALVIQQDIYGFCLLQNGVWINRGNKSYDSLEEKMTSKNYKCDEWFVAMRSTDLRFPLEYQGSDNEKFSFLLNEGKRGDAVQKLAKEIADEVKKFKDNLSIK